MIKKMLRHSLLSALIIGVLAGSFAMTLGSGLEPSRNDSHKHDDDHDTWDD